MAEFKTLTFPNTPSGQSEKIRALTRESRAGWTVVSETVVAGSFKGAEACCLFIICAPLAFLAGKTKGEITVTLQRTGSQPVGGSGVDIQAQGGSGFTGEEPPEYDPLLKMAAVVAIEHGQVSTSLLQRRLKVGYGRASTIMAELETVGILGPPDLGNRQPVLVGLADLDRIFGEG